MCYMILFWHKWQIIHKSEKTRLVTCVKLTNYCTFISKPGFINKVHKLLYQNIKLKTGVSGRGPLQRAGEDHYREQSAVPVSLLFSPPYHRHLSVLLLFAHIHPCSLQAPHPFVGGTCAVGSVITLLVSQSAPAPWAPQSNKSRYEISYAYHNENFS